MTALLAAHHTAPPDCSSSGPTKDAKADRTNGIVAKGKGRKITHDGKTLTINQWAKEIGISGSRLYHRLDTYKWPLEEALKPERRPRPPTYLRHMTVDTPDGPVTKPMSQWSAELGILISTISRRLSRGWTDAQALEFDPSPREQRRLDAAAEAEAVDPFDTEAFVPEPYDPDPFRIFPQED
jgi:hypothetical protein